jgi:hypothetical protein
MAKEARLASREESMQHTCRFFTGCLAVILLTGTAQSRTDEPPDEIDPANIIEKFAAARDGIGHLMIPVTIRNKKYLFFSRYGLCMGNLRFFISSDTRKAQEYSKRQGVCW